MANKKKDSGVKKKYTYRRWSKKEKERALDLVDAGHPKTDICRELGMQRATLHAWIRERKKKDAGSELIAENIEKQLINLSKLEPTEAVAKKIAMLTKAQARQKKLTERDKKVKRKPCIQIGLCNANATALRERMADDLGLFKYQRDFFESDAQFRIALKARQIGFSFEAGAEALLNAVDGRDQLFLSASEEQAVILTRYVWKHAEKLGIPLEGGDKEIRVVGGGTIKALAHNWRTVQGFSGDVWMDEFAWYPNPKKIWAAFVPSIGTVKGRLTIMSTPFESDGVFNDIWSNTDKYYMFDRFRITIHDAIKDGLDFDLETMRALFDEESWARAYECQFADDEASFYPVSLIKSCVDYGHSYFSPAPTSALYAGYDIGRVKDLSALAALEPADDGKLKLAMLDTFRKASFDEQEAVINNFMSLYPKAAIRIDKTGMGRQFSENMSKKYRERATGVYFTQPSKEIMALNMRKNLEDGRLILPNDPSLISDIHSIKRVAGQKSFKYDSNRNEHGHADRFWALALAASHPKIQTVGASTAVGGAWIF